MRVLASIAPHDLSIAVNPSLQLKLPADMPLHQRLAPSVNDELVRVAIRNFDIYNRRKLINQQVSAIQQVVRHIPLSLYFLNGVTQRGDLFGQFVHPIYDKLYILIRHILKPLERLIPVMDAVDKCLSPLKYSCTRRCLTRINRKFLP